MVGAGFPPCWLFGLRRPNTGAYPLFGGANGGLWDGSRQGVLPRTSAASDLVLTVRHSHPPHPASAGDPPTLAGRSASVSCGVTAPSPVSRCAHYFVCALQEWSFCFPQSCRSPAIKSRRPSKSDSLGIPPAVAGHQVGKPDVGLRTFTPVGGLLWYKYSPVCESPTQQLWDLIFCDCAPPTVSSWLLLWIWGIFFGEFQCLPVDDCSAVGCDSDALTEVSEEGVRARHSTPPS